ncbi:MAG TPA: PAS domain-containing sensor histidine kinase [Verrucomicrobiae bacterium]|nr:PAS domain-containing sensor histidine kinase [Verrucomicrobiae bacterium]
MVQHEGAPDLAQRLRELAPAQLRSHAVALLDPLGTIVDWYAGADRIFGYAASEVVGQNISLIFVPEDLARHIDDWERQTAARTDVAEDDRWQLRKDGARIWVTGTTTALRGSAGELLGFLKIMRERTDQKSQIAALESQFATLQQAEGQRVQFVSTLAHELRTPIGTIGNTTSILEQPGVAAPEIHFAASVIRRQVEFVARMINDLMEVVSTAVGKVTLHRERVILQDLLVRSIEACRSLIDQRKHRLHSIPPGAPIALDADPVRLQQVLVNLIENAAKYTPPGGTIWVRTTTEGDEAVVHIRDNGAGISPELMPSIFELFTQGESRRPQGGLGIGLALVRETVALHGGTVQATSDGVGKGSTFTVRLPLPDEASAA